MVDAYFELNPEGRVVVRRAFDNTSEFQTKLDGNFLILFPRT